MILTDMAVILAGFSNCVSKGVMRFRGAVKRWRHAKMRRGQAMSSTAPCRGGPRSGVTRGLNTSTPAGVSRTPSGPHDADPSGAMRRRCDLLVRFPMTGHVASLNAGVAGALLLFEVMRQRRDATR